MNIAKIITYIYTLLQGKFWHWFNLSLWDWEKIQFPRLVKYAFTTYDILYKSSMIQRSWTAEKNKIRSQ